MGVLLLLALLVSGFLFCLKHPNVYNRLHRYEGQLLYLQVARYGLVCVYLSTLFWLIMASVTSHAWGGYCWRTTCIPAFSTDWLGWLGTQFVALGLAKAQPAGQVAAFATLVGGMAMCLPAPWAKFLTWRLRKRLQRLAPAAAYRIDDQVMGTYLLRESVQHSPRLLMLYEAFGNREHVMLSMEDRKVYVGYILSLGAPTEVVGIDQEILLVPTLSGYRHEKTLKVDYTTHYAAIDVYSPIALRQEHIVSVTRFSESIRSEFEAFEHGPGQPRRAAETQRLAPPPGD
jgi:hypothetical protein